MDFFTQQDQARRRTRWLVGMFLLATLVVVGLVMLATWGLLRAGASDTTPPRHRWDTGPEAPVQVKADPTLEQGRQLLVILVGAGTAVLIGLGSLWKTIQLSAGGGSAVAQSLNGRLVTAGSRDPGEQRLMNVVQEMALASGLPVPEVYVLDHEPTINAFAAGLSPGDAVVAVTRGALNQLTRDELQGVVAHEFSHILNGDMRLHLRLIGILHGLLVLHLTGRLILQSMHHVRLGGKDGAGRIVIVILILGMILMAVGIFGYLAGMLLKAAIGRQREFLADAAAVQFTRNPLGIGNALRRLLHQGSTLSTGRREEFSHLFFGQALSFTWLATHPPLTARLDAIDPAWRTRPEPAPAMMDPGQAAAVHSRPAAAAPPSRPQGQQKLPASQVSALVGCCDVGQQEAGAQRLAELPTPLRQACGETYAARAVVLAALVDSRPGASDQALQVLARLLEPALMSEVRRLQAIMARSAQESPQAPLAAVLLAIPALRALSPNQRDQFLGALDRLIRADGVISLHEYALAGLVRHHLQPQPVGNLEPSSHALTQAAIELLAVLAQEGAPTAAQSQAAFDAGLASLGLRASLPTLNSGHWMVVARSLRLFRAARAAQRCRLLIAVAATVSADGVVEARELELLRLIADSLDCPMPV